ncbi:MAG TPA: hypothetical protein DHW78_03680 [Ruminococcaceae bacterium]|jgi:hypothetical protein|nr:hypothetical protein [Oscillospiraceae bacterium]
MNVCFYFKVLGLAQDEQGNPAYAGLKMDLGEAKPGVTYQMMVDKVKETPDWKSQFIKMLHLNVAGVKESDIELITPEEYERDYWDDGDDEDDEDA